MEQLLKDEIIQMAEAYGTGGLPETQKLGDKLYCQINLEPLKYLPAIRDPAKRFEQFEIDVVGKTVIEVGCHIGALSFYAYQRGAKKVIGVDTNEDRINTALAIRDYNQIPDSKIEFKTKLDPSDVGDVVICCAVDDYVSDRFAFYDYLLSHTKNEFVIESNLQTFIVHPLAQYLMERGCMFKTDGGILDHVYGHGRIRHLFKGHK